MQETWTCSHAALSSFREWASTCYDRPHCHQHAASAAADDVPDKDVEMVPGRADEIFDPGTMSEVGQRSCNSEDLALANKRHRWFAEYLKVFFEACISPPPQMCSATCFTVLLTSLRKNAQDCSSLCYRRNL